MSSLGVEFRIHRLAGEPRTLIDCEVSQAPNTGEVVTLFEWPFCIVSRAWAVVEENAEVWVYVVVYVVPTAPLPHGFWQRVDTFAKAREEELAKERERRKTMLSKAETGQTSIQEIIDRRTKNENIEPPLDGQADG